MSFLQKASKNFQSDIFLFFYHLDNYNNYEFHYFNIILSWNELAELYIIVQKFGGHGKEFGH